MDRFATEPQMPFEIERLHFRDRAEYTTQGKYLMAMTLTVGNRAIIRSKAHPERKTVIDRLQCALIPAGFGEFEVLAEGSCVNTVVLWRLKKG